MKIALLGDIHANLPALEAALAHARSHGAERIWNIGDFVGYGAWPDEVVKRLQQEGALSIVGNYDLKVLKFPKKMEKWRAKKTAQKWLAFRWAYEHLSPESLAYLASLPKEIRLEYGGKSILLTHGSPVSNEEPLTPETPEARLLELARLADTDVIICGHSHREFSRQVDGRWFINTGSVGRPDDGDPRAGYALLEIGSGVFDVRHYRLAYDVERVVAAIQAKGLPEAFGEMLRRGVDLEKVLRG